MKFILSIEEPNLEIEARNLKAGLKKLAERAAEIGLDKATLILGLATSNGNYLFSEKATNKAQKIFDQLLSDENENFYFAMLHGGNYQGNQGEWQGHSDNEMYL